MKKSLFVSLILLSGVLLTACGNKSEENTETQNPTTPAVSEECKNAVEEYLAWSDKQWEWDEVKAWDNIRVDYIWRLEDGTVFDTSIRSVAEACEIYNESRDYSEWLSFEAWAGQMVKWFDNGVIGMKIWQTKTVQFGPKEWYWEYDESLVVKVSKNEVWDTSQLSEWDTVYLGMGYPAKILKITDKEVTFDMNHELAGKNLIFDITLKENIGSELDTNVQNSTEETTDETVEEITEETTEETTEN